MTDRAHNMLLPNPLPQSKPLTERASGVGSVVLGRFRIVRVLAHGGMGEVFLARSEGAAGFVKPVVIKKSLGTSSTEAVEMFAREARILSNLHHPGIVGIVDFAEEQGDYTMVLEYVHGYTLGQWIRFARGRQAPIPVPLAVYCVVKILEALEYAHALKGSNGTPLGIVHRDIKPSNILVDVQGVVKIADFGIARANADATRTDVAGTLLKGTLSYMAPELFAGDRPSPASDVYSAAVTAYQLLTGINPFFDRNPVEAVARVAQLDPRPASALRSEVPMAVSEIVAKGMAKAIEERYRSAGEMAAALREQYSIDGRLDAAFRNAVQRAFHDASFADLNKTDSLIERAESWSAGTGRIDAQVELSTATVTVNERMPGQGERRPARAPAIGSGTPPLPQVAAAPPAKGAVTPRRSRLLLAVGVGIGLALSGFATAFLLWDMRVGEPTNEAIVMVRRRAGIENGSAAPAAPSVELVSTAWAPVTASLPADSSVAVPPASSDHDDGGERERNRARSAVRKASAARRRPPSLANGLAAAFRRHESDIVNCFERYPTPASQIQGLAIRFQIAKRGRVVSSSLTPRAIEGEPIGDCLLKVARTARFDPQETELQFRIPIRVAGAQPQP